MPRTPSRTPRRGAAARCSLTDVVTLMLLLPAHAPAHAPVDAPVDALVGALLASHLACGRDPDATLPIEARPTSRVARSNFREPGHAIGALHKMAARERTGGKEPGEGTGPCTRET